MGWRYVVRWLVRQRRNQVAIVAAVLATWLASRDHRTGWVVLVGTTTTLLAVASIRIDYTDAYPDREAVRQARHREAIEALVRRYEGAGPGAKPPRERHRARSQREQVAALVARYERDRVSAPEPAPRLTRAERREVRRQAQIDAIVARFEGRDA